MGNGYGGGVVAPFLAEPVPMVLSQCCQLTAPTGSNTLVPLWLYESCHHSHRQHRLPATILFAFHYHTSRFHMRI